MSTDALSTQGSPQGSTLIRTADEINAKLKEWRERFNVLSPYTQMGGQFGPGIVLTVSSVSLDPRVNDYGNGNDTYFSKAFMKAPDGIHAPTAQRAPNKVGLLRIAQCAGVRWRPNDCRRTDDGGQACYWAWSVAGEYLTPDGIWLPITGSSEVDLRDGSPQVAAMKPDQLKAARQYGNALSESKAKNRAIRSLGLQSTYTVDELQRKPFLVLRATFQPDKDDEIGRRVFAQVAMGATHMLYPGVAMPAALPPASEAPAAKADSDVVDVQPIREAAKQLVAPAPPAPPRLFVEHVESRPFRRMVHGKLEETVRHYVVDSNGEEHATWSAEMAEAAKRLQASRTPVDIGTSTNAAGTSMLEEIAPATLPLAGSDNY